MGLCINQRIDILSKKQKTILLQSNFVSKGWGRVRPKWSQVVDQQRNGPEVKVNSLIDLEFVNINTGARSASLWERRTPLPPSINSKPWSWHVPSKESQNAPPCIDLALDLFWIFQVPFDSPGIKILRPLSVFGAKEAPAGHAEVCRQFTSTRFFLHKIRLWSLCLCMVFDYLIHSRHRQHP